MASHPNEGDPVPLTDLEAAHLPAASPVHSLSRPPSYAEQDMEEPLPTYENIKQEAQGAQGYRENKRWTSRGRIYLLLGFGLLCIIIVAVSIAVTRLSEDNSINSNTSLNRV